jgi:hypothetical protein
MRVPGATAIERVLVNDRATVPVSDIHQGVAASTRAVDHPGGCHNT